MKTLLLIFIKCILILFFLQCFYNFIFDFEKVLHLENVIKLMYKSIIFSTVMLFIHYLFSKKVGVIENFSTNQKVILNNNINTVDLEAKVKKLTNWTLIDRSDDFLKFKTNINLKSFGEIITINEINNKTIITSKPNIYALFDFGKNHQNINFLKSLL